MLLLCKATTTPAAGAVPVRVTVPVELFPPTTVLAAFVTEDKAGAFTVNVTLRVFTNVAEMVTEVFVATGVVVIEKVADVLPAGTVTLAGTCAAEVLLLCNVTTAPGATAAAFSVTVPVELFPPITVTGFRDKEDSDIGAAVRVALRVTP